MSENINIPADSPINDTDSPVMASDHVEALVTIVAQRTMSASVKAFNKVAICNAYAEILSHSVDVRCGGRMSLQI